MATAESLEDMLSSAVDESVYTALVDSLESHLASPNIHLPSPDVNTTSSTTNHVNNAALVDNNVTRSLDGQKQGVVTVNQSVSTINPVKSAVVSSAIGDANASSTTTTNTSNAISTLPGALPASGYITQVTGNSQSQEFFSPVVTVNRSINNQEIKNVSQINNTCTINTRSKTAAAAAATAIPNGNPGLVSPKPNQNSSMDAIYDLANVASQQSPMVTSNTCLTTTPQVTVANGKQVNAVKSQPDPKSTEKNAKTVTIPQTVVQTTVIHPNLFQVSNPVIVSKSLPTTSQTVNVVSQMVTTNPNILTSLTSGVQIVNMNPRLGIQGTAGQKALAPRMMLTTNPMRLATPQILTGRAGVTGQGTITLSPSMVRGAVFLKAENGQFQVVNISGTSAGGIPGAPTYRLQSLPPGATGVRTVTPQIVTVPVSTAGLKTSQAGINGNMATPLTIQTTTANSQPSTPTQMSPNTAKKKCKNFLSTLIRLADEQPAAVAKSVRNLIQGIIDGTMQAEEFTAKLQKELNSAPQPYLVPFLKKNLPYLRHSLITKELTIEGVRPPPSGAVILPHPQQIQIGQKRPIIQPTTQVRLMASNSLATQILQHNSSLHQRLTGPRLQIGTQGKSLLLGKTMVSSSVAASSPATVTALQSKFPAKSIFIHSGKDAGKRTFPTLRTDDDLNDVTAMGGVNLDEESQKIWASNSEHVGTQIRSCKDESFLFSSMLHRRIHALAQKNGVDEVSQEVVNLISHASQVRLKNLIEKLSVITEHRIETPKADSRYEVTQDVKGQIKFIEELDRLEKRRHQEQEREILLRAARSRSKVEDPDQLKLKQKAKEMQRLEQEELRQKDANATALLAIGPKKKPKLDNSLSLTNQAPSSPFAGTGSNTSNFQARPRFKKVNIRDLLYLMEQERETVRKPLLYKSYLK